MHILAVLCHPRRNSFTGALLDAYMRGVHDAGATVEVADLYREGFSPLLTEADYAQFEGRAMPDDVLKEQARVERCDAVTLVFPLWWYAMPALLKGWFDRVFCAGWAYKRKHDPEGSLLRPRLWTLLVSVGSSQTVMDQHHYDNDLRHLWADGVLGYVAADPIDIHLMLDATWNPAARERHLEKAYQVGLQSKLLKPSS